MERGNREVRIIALAPVGAAKSALLGEIENTMNALQVPVSYADEQEARYEKNVTGADWVGEIERAEPTVVLEEYNPFNLLKHMPELFEEMACYVLAHGTDEAKARLLKNAMDLQNSISKVIMADYFQGKDPVELLASLTPKHNT